MQNSKGKLFIVGTPIGNLDDLSRRVEEILKKVDVIACEDTRRTKVLLTHIGAEKGKRIVSYYDHNERERAKEVLSILLNGKDIALVSDAGMPLIDDPGYVLVKLAAEEGIDIVPVPGPSAFLCALVGSGLPCDRFFFAGFLPRKKGRKTRLWQIRRMVEASGGGLTIIFYEAPHRVMQFFSEIRYFFGEEVLVAVGRELTKRYEEFVRGSIIEVISAFQGDPDKVRGEFTVVIYIPRKINLPEIVEY